MAWHVRFHDGRHGERKLKELVLLQDYGRGGDSVPRTAPSCSRISVVLIEQFGDIEALQDALRDVQTFPVVQIGKTCLIRARIATLARHLLRIEAV